MSEFTGAPTQHECRLLSSFCPAAESMRADTIENKDRFSHDGIVALMKFCERAEPSPYVHHTNVGRWSVATRSCHALQRCDSVV